MRGCLGGKVYSILFVDELTLLAEAVGLPLPLMDRSLTDSSLDGRRTVPALLPVTLGELAPPRLGEAARAGEPARAGLVGEAAFPVVPLATFGFDDIAVKCVQPQPTAPLSFSKGLG